jgi:DNA-binding transcriptional regulator YhcF (GntR family)
LNIQLQFDSGEPLYLQLAREIRKLIIEGQLPVGTQVPTGRELGATLGISRQTYTEAIAELRRAGLVSTRRGVGAFVMAVPQSCVIPLRRGDRILARSPTQEERDRLATGYLTWVLEITHADGTTEVHSAAVTVCEAQ